MQSDDSFLTSRQVKARYGGTSDMWIFRRLRDGSGFPIPIVVRGRKYWRLSELTDWERSRARYEGSQAAASA
jgi:hypothetical protein